MIAGGRGPRNAAGDASPTGEPGGSYGLRIEPSARYARRSGCDTIAHGCTGKGNDQVRIEGTVATLAPELKVIAPVRSWAMGRDEEIAYARKHGIPVKGGTESAPYSIQMEPACPAIFL